MHLRMVSAFAVAADESEEGSSDAEPSKVGALVFQLAEMLPATVDEGPEEPWTRLVSTKTVDQPDLT